LHLFIPASYDALANGLETIKTTPTRTDLLDEPDIYSLLPL
jgi:hypothetical protein